MADLALGEGMNTWFSKPGFSGLLAISRIKSDSLTSETALGNRFLSQQNGRAQSDLVLRKVGI